MIVSRPQPLGVFPLPAGYLLVPGSEHFDRARLDLTAGRIPHDLPSELDYYQRALVGDLEGALAALRTLGESPITRANRFVLDPNPSLLADLRLDALVEDDPAFSAFVETLAYIVGLVTAPPDQSDDVDGEFAALGFAAAATQALEVHDSARAIELLELAARAAYPVSRALSGQLMGQLANVQLDEGGVQRASVTFQAAIDQLVDTDLNLSRAELHVAAGSMFQEMSASAPRLMQEAINHYHAALALVTAQSAPETFAVANANLGLAYITMPMHEASDQLRFGVAIQSMREALGVFSPESHPERWSSTQLNLANALVYLPSSHQEANISEAVELYEEVLSHRDRHVDPLGRARVLANQGNALAHLAQFDLARTRLIAARSLFEEFEEDEAVRTVRQVLDEIVRAESAAGARS